MYDGLQEISVLSWRIVCNFTKWTKRYHISYAIFLSLYFWASEKNDKFNKTYVSNDYVTWKGELDIAPDSLYVAIAKSGNCILQQSINTMYHKMAVWKGSLFAFTAERRGNGNSRARTPWNHCSRLSLNATRDTQPSLGSQMSPKACHKGNE